MEKDRSVYIMSKKSRESNTVIRSYMIKQKANRRKHSTENLIITANMLKFHKDRRPEIAKAIHDK